MSQLWATIGICLASLAVAHSSVARAETRHVTVYSVRGPGAKKVRAFLEEQITARYKLVPPEAFTSAAEDLGIAQRRLHAANLKRIAQKARIDVVVDTFVYRSRRRWWLGMKVRDGGSGRTVKQGIIPFNYFALNRWTKGVLVRLLKQGVDAAEGVMHPVEPRVVRPPPRPGDGSGKPPTVEKKGPRPPYLTGIKAGFGVAIWGRRLTFSNLEGDPGSQVLYETDTPVLPLYLQVEAYPGAFLGRHRAFANLGLGFVFQRAVGVVSYREGENIEIATTIQRIGGYLAYRWNVKQSVLSPEIKFSLGFEGLEFSFGQDLGLVAGVLYVSFRPGVAARFPLWTERLSLSVYFAGLAVLDLGQMSNAYHYGAGRAGGLEVGVEFDVRLFWRVHLLVGAMTSWLFISFSQLGEQGVDYEYIADSARDGYYGGYALIAIHY